MKNNDPQHLIAFYGALEDIVDDLSAICQRKGGVTREFGEAINDARMRAEDALAEYRSWLDQEGVKL